MRFKRAIIEDDCVNEAGGRAVNAIKLRIIWMTVNKNRVDSHANKSLALFHYSKKCLYSQISLNQFRNILEHIDQAISQ